MANGDYTEQQDQHDGIRAFLIVGVKLFLWNLPELWSEYCKQQEEQEKQRQTMPPEPTFFKYSGPTPVKGEPDSSATSDAPSVRSHL